MKYLGHLSHHDPLYEYLKKEIWPQIGGGTENSFRVFFCNGSHDVYLYEGIQSGKKAIGKFFRTVREPEADNGNRRMYGEYEHLHRMRSIGFDRSPFYVARPLGCREDLNSLLVVEYCDGTLFSHVLEQAICSHNDDLLFRKLSALAWFLAQFHNLTAEPGKFVDFSKMQDYLLQVLGRLKAQGLMDESSRSWFAECGRHWAEQEVMWSDCPVTVHGDATPENFLMGDDPHVITFDLERLKQTDRCCDVGRMCGELAHFFLATTGNRWAAEPFIGHFLWEYSSHFPDREKTFRAITARIPFYLGMTLLRIARNEYLTWNYRQQLIPAAAACLKRMEF